MLAAWIFIKKIYNKLCIAYKFHIVKWIWQYILYEIFAYVWKNYYTKYLNVSALFFLFAYLCKYVHITFTMQLYAKILIICELYDVLRNLHIIVRIAYHELCLLTNNLTYFAQSDYFRWGFINNYFSIYLLILWWHDMRPFTTQILIKSSWLPKNILFLFTDLDNRNFHAHNISISVIVNKNIRKQQKYCLNVVAITVNICSIVLLESTYFNLEILDT